MRGLSLLLAGLLLRPVLARAQVSSRLKVATDFTDSTGVLASAFNSALRMLGDVDVVTTAEDPDLVLQAVVMCRGAGGCKDPESYDLAIRLYTPANLNTAMSVALQLPSLRGLSYDAALFRADTLGRRILPALQGLERSHALWVARWGRLRYEEQAREMVRTIDTQCLEKLRQARRAALSAGSDSARTAAYDTILSRRWLC